MAAKKIGNEMYEGTFNLRTNKILNVINAIGHDIGWLVWFFDVISLASLLLFFLSILRRVIYNGLINID